MRIQLETKRLILRNLTPDDYQAGTDPESQG